MHLEWCGGEGVVCTDFGDTAAMLVAPSSIFSLMYGDGHLIAGADVAYIKSEDGVIRLNSEASLVDLIITITDVLGFTAKQ